MNSNDYNLLQLLELALRVPEVGAVNFNILYYILKTIIHKQGLENIKPIFNLDAPLTVPSNITKAKLKKVSLKKSYSAESLQAISPVEALRKTEFDAPSEKVRSTEKESVKWEKILLFKRLDAVEDEISEIHVTIAQLVDKISNFERISGLQETKFLKEIAKLRHLFESKEEDPTLAQKLNEISADVSMLMSRHEAEREETEEKDDERESEETDTETESEETDTETESEETDTELDATKPYETKLDEIKQYDSEMFDTKLDETKSDVIKPDVIESYEIKSDEIKVDETKLDETKIDEIKSDESELENIISDETKIDKAGLSELPEPDITKELSEKKHKKSVRHKIREQELEDKIEKLHEEIRLIKEQLEVKL